jgi:membrane-associated phospholipid phosphatase
MTSRLLRAALLGSLLAGCDRARPTVRPNASDAELLQAAVHQVTSVMVYDILSPPQASRVYAYASVAAYEALRSAHPEYRTLAGQLNGLEPPPAPPAGAAVSLPLASVHAFMTVGRTLTFSRARADSLRAAMDERFRARGMSADEFAHSVAYGDSVAQHVLRWASKDRFLQTRGAPKFSLSAAPSRWVPTPPAYMDAVEPNWGALRPFLMDSAGQFRPEPPLPFDTAAGSPYMLQVREVYDVRRGLTDEQRALTAFWDCNPYVMHVQGHTMFATKKISPGGHWMGIVGIAARGADADMMRTAEAYARTALVLADGFISSWDEKFRSGMPRPETTINRYVDDSWEPLLQTPPFPEYTSGHSVISTAAAVVLTDQFGPDFAFLDSTETEYGLPPRRFASFAAAASEAAISRLYGGIHFRQAIEQGTLQGRRIGAHALARLRTRARAVPLARAAPRAVAPARPSVASVP